MPSRTWTGRTWEPTLTTVDLMQRYGGILASLVTDVIAIFVLSGFLYFRRHWRADLLLAYVALNIGIFVTMALLTQVKVDIAVGFGLFAILSIVRLRSGAVTQQEVAYYFLALVLGLVNGLGVPDRVLAIGMNLVLLLTMWAFDRTKLREQAERMDVKLEGVYTNSAALRAELERQLGRRVGYYEITEVDLIRSHMLVDVRLRPGEGVVVPPKEKKKAQEHPVAVTTPDGAVPRDPGAPQDAAVTQAMPVATVPGPPADDHHNGAPRHGV